MSRFEVSTFEVVLCDVAADNEIVVLATDLNIGVHELIGNQLTSND